MKKTINENQLRKVIANKVAKLLREAEFEPTQEDWDSVMPHQSREEWERENEEMGAAFDAELAQAEQWFDSLDEDDQLEILCDEFCEEITQDAYDSNEFFNGDNGEEIAEEYFENLCADDVYDYWANASEYDKIKIYRRHRKTNINEISTKMIRQAYDNTINNIENAGLKDQWGNPIDNKGRSIRDRSQQFNRLYHTAEKKENLSNPLVRKAMRIWYENELYKDLEYEVDDVLDCYNADGTGYVDYDDWEFMVQASGDRIGDWYEWGRTNSTVEFTAPNGKSGYFYDEYANDESAWKTKRKRNKKTQNNIDMAKKTINEAMLRQIIAKNVAKVLREELEMNASEMNAPEMEDEGGIDMAAVIEQVKQHALDDRMVVSAKKEAIEAGDMDEAIEKWANATIAKGEREGHPYATTEECVEHMVGGGSYKRFFYTVARQKQEVRYGHSSQEDLSHHHGEKSRMKNSEPAGLAEAITKNVLKALRNM